MDRLDRKKLAREIVDEIKRREPVTQFERDATLSILLSSERITDAEKQAIRDLVPSRRDYFAAVVLNGIAASGDMLDQGNLNSAIAAADQFLQTLDQGPIVEDRKPKGNPSFGGL